MVADPLVSVVMPTYNRNGVVQRAIASVLNQTYLKLELLVVDDGSKDGTEEALSCFKTDPRFMYYYQENKGQSAARNVAISKASGEVIAFLDSDNFWMEDKLSRQLAFWSAHDEYDILYSDGINVDQDGTRLPTAASSNRCSGNILTKLLFSNFVTNNTALVPVDCFRQLGCFDESLRIAEDFDLWLRFATRYTFLHHPEQVAYYCVEGDRLSAQEEKNIQVNFQILKRFFQQYPNLVKPLLQRKALGNLLVWQTESRWNRGIRPPLNDLLYSLTSNPLDLRVWRHLAKFIMKIRI